MPWKRGGYQDARSIRRIIEQVTSRKSTRKRTANALATVVDTVLAYTVNQPVSPLRSVNQRSAGEWV